MALNALNLQTFYPGLSALRPNVLSFFLVQAFKEFIEVVKWFACLRALVVPVKLDHMPFAAIEAGGLPKQKFLIFRCQKQGMQCRHTCTQQLGIFSCLPGQLGKARGQCLRGLEVGTSDGIIGLCQGVDDQGALQVMTAEGRKAISSSEVSVRPQ